MRDTGNVRPFRRGWRPRQPFCRTCVQVGGAIWGSLPTGQPLPSAAGVTRRCHLPRRGRQGCFVGAGALDSPLVGHGRRSAGDRKGRPYRGTFVCFVGAGALDSPLVGHARRSAERSGDRSLRGNAGLRLNSEFFSSPLRIHSSLFSLPFFPQLC